MEGKFRARIAQMLFAVLMMFGGTVLTVRFALWGIDAIEVSDIANAVFCFGFSLAGLGFGMLSIVVANYDRGAALTVDDEKINIVCALSKEITLVLADVEDVKVQGSSIIFFTVGGKVTVNRLMNAHELRDYIRGKIKIKIRYADVAAESEMFNARRRKLTAWLAFTVLCAILMFVGIFICVALTGGRELSDFTYRDTVIFLVFTAFEIASTAMLFLCVARAGKHNLACAESKTRILISQAYGHRRDGLDNFGELVGAKYFVTDIYRIVIFKHKDGIYAYMLERFDQGSTSWNNCYEKARGFRDIGALYAEIEATFSDYEFEDLV